MEEYLKRLLPRIGVMYLPGREEPVFEDDFIKFMSDGGDQDIAQADEFEIWLKANNLSYERFKDDGLPDGRMQPRKFTLNEEAAAKIQAIFDECI